MNHFERPSTVDCNVTTVTKEAHDLKPKTCFFPHLIKIILKPTPDMTILLPVGSIVIQSLESITGV